MTNAFELFERLTGESLEQPQQQAQPEDQGPHITLLGSGRVQIDYDAQRPGGFDWGTVNAIKTLPGRKYEGGSVNTVDLTVKVLEVAQDRGLRVADEVREALAEEIERTESMQSASRADDADLQVPDTIALDPRPYQRAGIAYALESNRTFIADDQGLGKTMQAQAVVEIRQAYPALVLCKAKLRSNWRNEINLTLPDRKVQVLHSQTPFPIDPDADFVVINYDVLDFWADDLITHGFQALIIDESQYVKNHETRTMKDDEGIVVRDERGKPVREYKTNRVRATKRVADSLPDEAPVLLLTGTAMMNRPIELAPQLDIMGRLDEFGGFFRFAKRYADAHNNGYGWDFSGSSNRSELREKLRSRCLVRRLKKDVLDELPEKDRIYTWLELNGELAAYDQAFEDGPGDGEAATMAWMSTLRRLVGEAKVPSAIEWIEDFLDVEDSEETPSLVVFAHHIAVQHAIADHLGDRAVTIFSGDSDADVDDAKTRFQAGEVPVLVGSLEAASEGHTLTRAHDVLMVERAWTPKREEQAEDRTHRLGQTEQVTIHYLLASGTIDEEVSELVDDKRAIINEIQDGEGELTAEQESLLTRNIEDELARILMERREGN